MRAPLAHAVDASDDVPKAGSWTVAAPDLPGRVLSTSVFREAESPESRPAVRVPEARPLNRALIYALLADFWDGVAARVVALAA